MTPTLDSVIFSANYAKDNIVVLMLKEASNSALFAVALDSQPYAFSVRLANMRDERDVQAWYSKLEEKDFDGLHFYEFNIAELTKGQHQGIKTKKGNVANVIRRASPLKREDMENQLKAQFESANNIEWA